MNENDSPPVLHINKKGNTYSFLLEYKNISVPGQLKVNQHSINSIYDEIESTMYTGGQTRSGQRGVTLPKSPNVANTHLFSRITTNILPISIQRELKKLVTTTNELIIKTDEYSLPWEMLELFDYYCPMCNDVVTNSPTCQNCSRVLFPNTGKQSSTCICGESEQKLLLEWSPSCNHDFDFKDIIVRPTLHLGLGFALERSFQDIDKAENKLQSLEDSILKPMSILFIENPGDLYYSEPELQELRSFIQNNPRIVKAHILDRENANKDSIRNALEKYGPFDIVHFVGHGYFSKDDPQSSYLSLSSDQKLLVSEVKEIFEGFAPKLAILNGCQTAMVANVDNNIIGFPISFMEIGTQAVLGTLSAVADQQACYLILYLYHELLQGTSLNKALLFSKRRLSRKDFDEKPGDWLTTNRPGFMYSWSSYMIYGEGSLRPRNFPTEHNWRHFSDSAFENFRNYMRDHAPEIENLDDFFEQNNDKHLEIPQDYLSSIDKNLYLLLESDKYQTLQTIKYQSQLSRHIVCIIDLSLLSNIDEINKFLSESILNSNQNLSKTIAYIDQLTTNESACLIFVLGLDKINDPNSALNQINKISNMSNGSIKFFLEGSKNIFAHQIPLLGGNFKQKIYNDDEYKILSSGFFTNNLRAKISNYSQNELSTITKDEWDPEKNSLYVPRIIIEDQIYEFLNRPTLKSGAFCVLGETGRGKTNLLCRIYNKYNKNHQGGKESIVFFSTALGLNEQIEDGKNIRSFFEELILKSVFGNSANDNSNNNIYKAINMIKTELKGKQLELIIIIDAVNEVGGIEIESQFTENLLGLIKEMEEFESHGLYMSIIISSRSFSWRTLWSGREIDHKNYFPNLSLENGTIEENLLDFDLMGEAREAYILSGITPEWDKLKDEFKILFRTPFFLNIVKSISNYDSEKKLVGTYYDIMGHYEDIILLRNSRSAEGLKKSEVREVIINAIVKYLADNKDEKSGNFSLVQEISLNDLRNQIDNYSHEEINNVVLDLCEDNVLDNRGSKLRFAFDMFFDYLFRNEILRNSRKTENRELYWFEVINKYYKSEYHRHGISSALANELLSYQFPEDGKSLLLYLFNPKDTQFIPPSYYQLIQDSLILYGEENPTQLASALNFLYEEINDHETIVEIACSVIGSSQIQRNNKQDLISVIENVLQNFMTTSRSGQKRKIRRSLINIIGGLGNSENGVELVMDIVSSILGINYINGQLPDSFHSLFDIFLDYKFQKALSKIRVESIDMFKEEDRRIKMIFKVVLTTLKYPKVLFTLLLQTRYISILRSAGDSLRRMEISLEIIIKGAFLWFSEKRGSAEEKFIQSINLVDDFLEKSILVIIIKHLETSRGKENYKLAVIENISFYVGLIGIWPEVNRLFSYSEKGLDYLEEILKSGKGPELSKIMHLLNKDLSLLEFKDSKEKIYNLYLQPDAFRNYLGMLITIVQGTANFDDVEDILQKLIDNPFKDEFIHYGQKTVPKKIKVRREVFSIFTYIIRRTAQLNNSQIMKPINFIEKFTLDFFAIDFSNNQPSDNLISFLQLELFGREDPFNPLLPIGIASQHIGANRLTINGHQNYLNYLISSFYKSNYQQRFLLIDRVFRELIPISYFAPIIVVGTLEDFIKTQKRLIESEIKIRESLIDVLNSLDLVIGNHIENMFDYLETYADILKTENSKEGNNFKDFIYQLEKDSLGKSPSPNEIEHLYRSIDVYGGHDMVTTLFLEYEYIRNQIVPFISNEILKVNTASQLVYGVVKTLISMYFSDEINFSISKLVFENLPEKIANDNPIN